MSLNLGFFLAIFALCATGISVFVVAKQIRMFHWTTAVAVVGIAISALCLFLPAYTVANDGEDLRSFLLSLHSSMRLFAMEGDYDAVFAVVSLPQDWWFSWMPNAYMGILSILCVLAPLLTVSVVLSLIGNVLTRMQYAFNRKREVFVFSELSAKSVTLAKDIKAHHPRSWIIFTDVFEQNNETSYDEMQELRELKAICYKQDIAAVRFVRYKNQKAPLYFFVIGEDESENLNQALKLIERYGYRENTHLYFFSAGMSRGQLLTPATDLKMKVRRIDEARALVNRLLYDDGARIFQRAREAAEEGQEALLSAVIVGMGQYGTEMMRSLIWFGQMDGYRLSIDAFDQNPLAEDMFTALCPEIMSDRYNGVYVAGEAQYRICIHSGLHVETQTFSNEIAKLKHATYVLVSLGSDTDNVRVAMRLRMLFERIGAKPIIQAVVHSSTFKRSLGNITNFRGQPYDIELIGDFEASYAEKVVMDSELEEDALARHLKWGDEVDFWRYEYNYQSSAASAIHMKARIACGIAGAEKREEDLTEAERAAIEVLEHRRWNAYMRSQGYVYSGSPDRASRNDLAKMHHNLVDFDALPEDIKRIDGRVGSK